MTVKEGAEGWTAASNLSLLPDFLFIFLLDFLKKDFIYSFLERGEGREKEGGEKHQRVVAS